MGTVTVAKTVGTALQTAQVIRNDRYPTAAAQTKLQQDTNHLLKWRTKEVGSFSCGIDNIPATTSSSRARWRAAYHSSTHARYLWVLFVAAQVPADVSGTPDPYVKLVVEDADGAEIGTAEFHYGAVPAASVDDLPSGFGSALVSVKDGGVIVEIERDADLYFRFSDEDTTSTTVSRLVAATIYEEALEPHTDNEYLENGVAVNGPIVDEDRGDMVVALRNAWHANGAQLWNWSSNTDADAPSGTSGTAENLVDASTGAPTAATPGVTLDLSNCSTIRRGTVPCVMQVFAKTTGSGEGHVYLIDSSNNVVAEISSSSDTAQWYRVAFELPAASDKYDLQFDSDGVETTTVYAVSIYQHSGTDVLVSIADSKDPVITSANYSYTIVANNTGNETAFNLTAELTLDPQTTFVSASGTDWTCSHNAGVVTCTRDTLAPGAAPTITVTVTSPSSAETSSATVELYGTNFPTVSDTETTVCNLVDIDAASGWRMPSSSTQWTNFLNFHSLSAISVPNSLWLMQEASGNLADSIGSLTLTAVTSPLYNQAATGFTRLGVAGDDNTNDRFGAAAAVGPDPTTTSQTWMCFARLGTNMAGTRRVLGINNTTGTNSVRLQLVTTTNRVGCQVGASTTQGVVDVPTGKHVFGSVYNRTASHVSAFSELEYVTGSWSAGIVDGAKGFGTVNTPGDFQYVYAWLWTGAGAEISQSNMSALLAAMGVPMSW